MDLGLLGSLYIQHAGVVTAPTAPKLRTVLAMLVVQSDQVVPVSSLIRELWNDTPPATGLATLQTYILNLRKSFVSLCAVSPAVVSRDILVTRAGGYLFRTSDCVVDIHQYHGLVAEGRRSLADDDFESAVRTLAQALELWRGDALIDVPCGRTLESKRSQFEESRLVVQEYLIDAQLRLGMYWEVLTQLAGLIAENPVHEGLHGQYMRALYLSGRRAQALELYHRLRGNLIEGLGLEPGPDIQRLHHAILTSDESVADYMQLKRPVGDIVRTAAGGGPRHY